MPVFEQPEDTPESLIIQIDDEDLTADSRERMKRFFNQDVVDYTTLQANVGLDPQRQLNMAREIKDNLEIRSHLGVERIAISAKFNSSANCSGGI